MSELFSKNALLYYFMFYVIIISEAGVADYGVIMAGNNGRRGYIHHTAVSPEYRKQGVATELVNTAMNVLESIGIAKVSLVVFEQNEIGNAFWKAQGFTVRNDLIYRNKAIKQTIRIDT